MEQIVIRKKRWQEARSIFLKEIEFHLSKGTQEVEVLHGIGDYILRKMVIAEVEKIDYVEILFTPEGVRPNDGVLRLKILMPDKSRLDNYFYR